MSLIGVTTHDLFMRLGSTMRLRSARADAVFRRLRLETAIEADAAVTGGDKAARLHGEGGKSSAARLKTADRAAAAKS